MATSRAIIKTWFLTGEKPTQGQFAELINSCFNLNDDTIGIADITGLSSVLAGKQTALGYAPEDVANKATSFAIVNDTKYPTTKAVSDGFLPYNGANNQLNMGTYAINLGSGGQVTYITKDNIKIGNTTGGHYTQLGTDNLVFYGLTGGYKQGVYPTPGTTTADAAFYLPNKTGSQTFAMASDIATLSSTYASLTASNYFTLYNRFAGGAAFGAAELVSISSDGVLNIVGDTYPGGASGIVQFGGGGYVWQNYLDSSGNLLWGMHGSGHNAAIQFLNVAGGGDIVRGNGDSVAWLSGGSLAGYLQTSGGTMTGPIVLSGDPTLAMHAASRNYVDNIIIGVIWVGADVATTANITLSGEQTIDGVTTSASRVFVKNQTDQKQNGIYISAAGAWARASDAATGAQIIKLAIIVNAGTAQARTQWVNTNSSVTVGTTNITFTQNSGIGTYTNGTGITLTGTAFGLDTSYTDGLYVSLSGSYANPSWISSLAYSKLTGAPTNVSTFTNDANFIATADNASLSSLVISGTAGAGIINLVAQSTVPTSPASGHQIIYADASGRFTIMGSNGFSASLTKASISANHIYTFPDVDGTFAILGATGQLFTGTNTFGPGTYSGPAYSTAFVESATGMGVIGIQNTNVSGYSAINTADNAGAQQFSFGYANASTANYAGTIFFNSPNLKQVAFYMNGSAALTIAGTKDVTIATKITSPSFVVSGSSSAKALLGDGTTVNATISGVSLGNNLSTLTATNTSLTLSGSYNGSSAQTIGLNVNNANTWTALQTFSGNNFKAVHFIGGSSAPTIAAGAGAGTSPTVSIGGSDVSGTITITTGTSPSGSNAIIATITFATTWTSFPRVILTPGNRNAQGLSIGAWPLVPVGGQTNGVTTTTFVMESGATALTASTTYLFTYHAIQ